MTSCPDSLFEGKVIQHDSEWKFITVERERERERETSE